MAPSAGRVGKLALEAAALVAVLGLVAAVQFVPHLDTHGSPPPEEDPALVGLAKATAGWVQGDREGYPYPVHVDEHIHWARTAKTQELEAIVGGSPYSSDPSGIEGLTSLRGAVHEAGFWGTLAPIQDLTGVSWLNLFQFGPALWMAFTAFAVYALLRPHPAALPAAAFVGLSPTSLRFLGTGFLVPIGVSMAWLPVVAILVEPARRRTGAALLLSGTVAWAFFVHLIGGFAAAGIVACSVVAARPEERRELAAVLAGGLAPVAWLAGAFTRDVQRELERVGDLPLDFTIFDHLGLLSLGLWVVGMALLGARLREDEELGSPTAVGGLAGLSLVALALIVLGTSLDLDRYATYDRWHPPFFLAATVAVGYALTEGGRLLRDAFERGLERIPGALPRSSGGEEARGSSRLLVPAGRVRGLAPTGRSLPSVLALVLAVAVVVPVGALAYEQGLEHHLEEPYYRVMDDETWDAYTWIAENVDRPPYEVFLAHPWQAPMLTGLGGFVPHAYLTPGSPPVNGGDYVAYLQGDLNRSFYASNGITVVVGPEEPSWDAFEEVRDRVYLVDEETAREIHQARQGG